MITEIYKGGKEAGKIDRMLTEGASFRYSDYYVSCFPESPSFDGDEYILFLIKPEIGHYWLWDNCALVFGGKEDVFKVKYDANGEPYIVGRFPEMTFEWLRSLEN